MHYEKSGSGPIPLLLIHGNVASARWWQKVMALLPAEKFTAYAPDLRGFGQSDKPGKGQDIPTYAEDIADFVAALGIEPAAVVGHSLGGSIAMQLTLEHPELVRWLILVDSGPAEGLTTPPQNYSVLEAMKTNRDLMRMALIGVAPTATQGDFFESLVDDAMLAAPVAADNARSLEQVIFTPHLGEIGVPVVVVWGEKDALVPRDATERTAAGIRGSRFIILDGVGHSAPIEAPERLVEFITIAFLKTEKEPPEGIHVGHPKSRRESERIK